MSYNLFIFSILGFVALIGLGIYFTAKLATRGAPKAKTLWLSRGTSDQVVHIVETYQQDSKWHVSYESVNFGKLKILRHRRYTDFKRNYRPLTSGEALKYIT